MMNSNKTQAIVMAMELAKSLNVSNNRMVRNYGLNHPTIRKIRLSQHVREDTLEYYLRMYLKEIVRIQKCFSLIGEEQREKALQKAILDILLVFMDI